MLTPAEKAAEARLADQRRDADLFGASLDDVMFLRRRGYSVVVDGNQFRVDGRLFGLRDLHRIVARNRRQAGVPTPRKPGRAWRTRWAPSGHTIAERIEFYSVPEPNSGCMLWLANCYPNGYGRLGHMGAHRASYLSSIGPIPAGLFVCHKCDVPSCVNPGHLFLGTALDNAQDRDKKGRRPAIVGEKQGSAKLTESAVLAIRADRRPLKEIAADFGVHIMTVSNIKTLATWAHLPGPPPFRAHRWTPDIDRDATSNVVAFRPVVASGFKGVYRNSKSSWAVRISHAGKKINLGFFPTAEEAAAEYARALSELPAPRRQPRKKAA